MTETAAEGSLLHDVIFQGGWEQRLPRDRDGRIFLDENPVVFRAVMDAFASARVLSSFLVNPHTRKRDLAHSANPKLTSRHLVRAW